MCGENFDNVGKDIPFMGSSPRVRGKRITLRAARVLIGLIPACAGKTPEHRAIGRRAQAHPRVCGENSSSP